MNRDEVEQIQKLNAEARKPKEGPVYLYRTTCRCPHCGAYWTTEDAEPAGVMDPRPHAAKLNLALLCGECEARRRLWIRVDGGNQVEAWRPEDTDHVWAILRGNYAAYAPQVVKIGPYDGSPLRDDKRDAIEAIRGKPPRSASMVSEAFARERGWIG